VTAAFVLWALSGCGGEKAGPSGVSGGPSQQPTVVDEFFDLCQAGRSEEARELLGTRTRRELDLLLPHVLTGESDPWALLTARLGRLPRPTCRPGEATADGAILECTNLAGPFQLRVVVEEGRQRLLLPSLR